MAEGRAGLVLLSGVGEEFKWVCGRSSFTISSPPSLSFTSPLLFNAAPPPPHHLPPTYSTTYMPFHATQGNPATLNPKAPPPTFATLPPPSGQPQPYGNRVYGNQGCRGLDEPFPVNVKSEGRWGPVAPPVRGKKTHHPPHLTQNRPVTSIAIHLSPKPRNPSPAFKQGPGRVAAVPVERRQLRLRLFLTENAP